MNLRDPSGAVRLSDAQLTNPVAQGLLQGCYVERRIWQCCANCLRLDGKTQVCSKIKAIPYPTTAVVGCDDWDGLPF